jgi:hypothetical protein
MDSIKLQNVEDQLKKKSFGEGMTAAKLDAFHNPRNNNNCKMAEPKKEQIYDAYVIEGVVDAGTFFVLDKDWIGPKPDDTTFDLYFAEGYVPNFSTPKINVTLRKVGQFRGYPINKINTDNYGVKSFNKIEKDRIIYDSKIINPYYK